MIGDHNLLILDISDSSIEDIEELEPVLAKLKIPYQWIDGWLSDWK